MFLKSKLASLLSFHNTFEKFYIPRSVFFDEAGNQRSLRDFHGKIVVLYFFSSWCSECILAMNQLDKFKEQLVFQGVNDIEIVPVSIDFKPLSEVRENYLRSLTNINIFADSNKQLYGSMGVTSLPTTFIINKKSVVVFGFKGIIDYNDVLFLGYLSGL